MALSLEQTERWGLNSDLGTPRNSLLGRDASTTIATAHKKSPERTTAPNTIAPISSPPSFHDGLDASGSWVCRSRSSGRDGEGRDEQADLERTRSSHSTERAPASPASSAPTCEGWWCEGWQIDDGLCGDGMVHSRESRDDSDNGGAANANGGGNSGKQTRGGGGGPHEHPFPATGNQSRPGKRAAVAETRRGDSNHHQRRGNKSTKEHPRTTDSAETTTAKREQYLELISEAVASWGMHSLPVADLKLGMAVEVYEPDANGRGRYSALRLYEDAFRIYQTKMGDADERTLDCRVRVGRVQLALGRNDEALDSFCQALYMREAMLGDMHPQTSDTWLFVASVHRTTGKLDLALKASAKALRGYRNMRGDKDPMVLTVLRSIGYLHTETGNHSKAADIKQYLRMNAPATKKGAGRSEV